MHINVFFHSYVKIKFRCFYRINLLFVFDMLYRYIYKIYLCIFFNIIEYLMIFNQYCL